MIASRADFVLVTCETVEAMVSIEAILDQRRCVNMLGGLQRRWTWSSTLLAVGWAGGRRQAATESLPLPSS